MALSMPGSLQEPQSSHTISNLIRDCRKAAKDKQWDRAVQLASTALQSPDAAQARSRVSILDTRVALYLRIEKLDLALKDAKAMIRSDRTDGRGYIRCGQVERAKVDHRAAIRFYEHGLKYVPVSSQYHQTILKELQAARDQIRINTTSSKPTDPMQTLPLEVVELILSALSYKQHVRMLGVCKAWNRLVRRLRPLSDTLAFPGASRDITTTMLHAALKRLKCPTAIHISRLTEASSRILTDRMQYWQNFTSLSILEAQDKHFVPKMLPLAKYDLKTVKFGSETAISGSTFIDILRKCTGLEFAHFENIVISSRRPTEQYHHLELLPEGKNLQYLHLQSRAYCFDPAKFFTQLPRLKHLSFAGLISNAPETEPQILDLRHMEQLETLVTHDCNLPCLYLPASIRSLAMTSTVNRSDVPIDLDALDNWTNLESLTFWHCKPAPLYITSALRRIKFKNLTEIAFSYDTQSGFVFDALVHSNCVERVRKLRLNNPKVHDGVEWTLSPSYFPQLEELVLEETGVPGTFISDLIKLTPNKLRKITLVKCPNVSGDIVPWAQARGIEMGLFKSWAETGRKVRHAD